MMNAEEGYHEAHGKRFADLEMVRPCLIELDNDKKAILRRDASGVKEAIVDKDGNLESLSTYSCLTRNAEGDIGYLAVSLLYLEKEHQDAERIFQELKRDIEDGPETK